MKIEKITAQPVELDITGVTLLSIEEAEALPKEQLDIGKRWWLRSPGGNSRRAADVYYDGSVYEYGNYVHFEHGIRPAFQIANLKSSNLQVGDRIAVAGVPATVISDTMALADNIVGYSQFREDGGASDANDYEKSDVKRWLDGWRQERCPMATVQRNGMEQTSEIYLAVVQQNWKALEYVEEDYQTPEICLAAVQQNGNALQWVKKQTPEICLAAVKQNGEAFQDVKGRYQTPELCALAYRQDPNSKQYFKDKSPEFMHKIHRLCTEMEVQAAFSRQAELAMGKKQSNGNEDITQDTGRTQAD